MKISKQEQIFIIIFIVAAIIGVGFFVFILPNFNNIEVNNKNLASAKTKYAELQITDKTVPPRDLWEGLGEDTLRGVFLTKMKTLLDESADEEEREKVLLAVRYGINAIENREM